LPDGTDGPPPARWDRAKRLVRKAEYEAVYSCAGSADRGRGNAARREGGDGGTRSPAAGAANRGNGKDSAGVETGKAVARQSGGPVGLQRAGGRLRSPQFVVFYCANGSERSRFGISVKKALGGAVVRNRIRRRIREILRLNYLEIPSGWDMVMHPRRSVANSEFTSLQAELIGLLRTIRSGAERRMRDSSLRSE
jgi:ribonuclease P protein component